MRLTTLLALAAPLSTFATPIPTTTTTTDHTTTDLSTRGLGAPCMAGCIPGCFPFGVTYEACLVICLAACAASGAEGDGDLGSIAIDQDGNPIDLGAAAAEAAKTNALRVEDGKLITKNGTVVFDAESVEGDGN